MCIIKSVLIFFFTNLLLLLTEKNLECMLILLYEYRVLSRDIFLGVRVDTHKYISR